MNILLYAPDLTGHPQVYCKVIIDALINHASRIVLACNRSSLFQWTDWPEISYLEHEPKLEVVDCSNSLQSYLRAEDLLEIQASFQIDVSIFIEADKFRNEFIRIYRKAAQRLKGRTIGIFARTQSWHPGEEFYSGYPLPKFAPTLKGNLGRLKRLIVAPETWDNFFYEQILIKNKVVDALLVKDERVSEYFGEPVYWMPEIFRPFNQIIQENDQQFIDFSDKFINFYNSNSCPQVLLFFGTGSWYRGYDLFLKLVEQDPDIVGVHCGAPVVYEPGKEFLFDLDLIRENLKKQRRLFETHCYIQSWKLVDFLYSYSSHAVSTHRLTGSSGTVLQAMFCGNPVLVPDTGLLGYRNKKCNLGSTYEYAKFDSLKSSWLKFKTRDPKEYSPQLNRSMSKFRQENVNSFFQELVFTT